ncbi:hypothetical protein LCGC14_0347860 [marine sediment metagenome]|uniref:DNA-directed DNA polymerase n=1 Tax=marine sediment metagenome TaxID=412755 RepID=A0A0F9THJ7_9ZZZZ
MAKAQWARLDKSWASRLEFYDLDKRDQKKLAGKRKHPLAKCEECPLERKVCVPGFGTRKAQIVWCGESPGAQELWAREPYIGPAGKLLKEILKEESIPIEDCWFTNSTLCLMSEDEEWAEKEIQACSDRLFDEIAEVNPKLVVALGADAFYSLTGFDEKITLVSGTMFKTKDGKYDVLPIIHPAYVLHNEGEVSNFRHYVRQVFRLVYAPSLTSRLKDPNTTLVLDEDWEDACNLVHKKASKTGKLLIDIESTAYDPLRENLLIVGVSPDGINSYLFPTAEFDEDGEWLRPIEENVPEESIKFKQLNKLISEREAFEREGHNVDFDQKWLKSRGFDVYFTRDTFLADYTMHEQAGGHGLKSLINYHFGNDDWEKTLKKGLGKIKNYADIPVISMNEYAGKDVAWNWSLGESQRNELMTDDDKFVHDEILIKCMHTFSATTLRGYKVDLKKSLELVEELTDKLDYHASTLRDLVEDTSFNPGSSIKVSAYLYDELGLPTILGRNSQAKTLRAVQSYCIDRVTNGNDTDGTLAHALEFIDSKLEYASLAKEVGTYVVGIVRKLGPDLRLHPRVRLSGAVTGRIAMDEPSLLNFLKGSRVREQIVPDNDEWLIAEADAKQFELRYYADYIKDETLTKGLANPDYDPHDEATTLIFKQVIELCRIIARAEVKEVAERAYEDLKLLGTKTGSYLTEEARRAVFYSKLPDNISAIPFEQITKAFSDCCDIYRRIAKTVVFGLLYNRGAQAIARAFRITYADALLWIEAIKGPWEGVPRYEDYVRKCLDEDGRITSQFRRWRRAPSVNDTNWHEWFNAFINFPIQSACNDINMLNMNLLYNREEELGIKVMWPIHDSQIFQVRKDGYKERLAFIQTLLEENIQKLVGAKEVKFAVETKVGPDWYNVKDVSKFELVA